jgi:hypothetical protein
MNKILTPVVLLLIAASSGYAAFNLSGTALTNPAGVNSGDVAVYIISTDGTSFATGLSSIATGVSITDSGTYGSSFSTFTASTSATASSFIGTTSVGSGVSTDLTAGINTNDQFGIVVYAGSTTDTVADDTYSVFTSSSWLVGTDGTFNFGSGADYPTLAGASAVYTGTVGAVPEPSAFALLSGALALGWVMVRRRA